MNVSRDILEQVKKQLQDEKTKLDTTLASLIEQDPYSDPERLSDNAASDTEAKEESSHERMEALEKELTHKREAIVLALQRIESGSFGICENCGKQIEVDRLKVNPTAKLCVSCQGKIATA